MTELSGNPVIVLEQTDLTILTDMVLSPDFTKDDMLKYIKNDVIRVGQNNSNMTSRAVYAMKLLHGMSDEEIYGTVLEVESDAVSQLSSLPEEERELAKLQKELEEWNR